MFVKIKIKTAIFHDEGDEIMEAEAFGRFYQKSNANYLQYDEESEAGLTRTIVKVSADEALILRSGAIKMKLPFVLQQKMNGSYELPFGKFAICSFAKRIDHSYLAESGRGHIDLRYDFSIQETLTTYHLVITFQEEEK